LGLQVTAKDMKMENVCWAETNRNDFYVILGAPARITLLPQGSQLGHQVTARGTKIESVCWVKNINDFM
tara:strand:+ start:867 stop:1073 length:207 start_codon:yes stop_codon:yes gene_type:complete